MEKRIESDASIDRRLLSISIVYFCSAGYGLAYSFIIDFFIETRLIITNESVFYIIDYTLFAISLGVSILLSILIIQVGYRMERRRLKIAGILSIISVSLSILLDFFIFSFLNSILMNALYNLGINLYVRVHLLNLIFSIPSAIIGVGIASRIILDARENKLPIAYSIVALVIVISIPLIPVIEILVTIAIAYTTYVSFEFPIDIVISVMYALHYLAARRVLRKQNPESRAGEMPRVN